MGVVDFLDLTRGSGFALVFGTRVAFTEGGKGIQEMQEAVSSPSGKLTCV